MVEQLKVQMMWLEAPGKTKKTKTNTHTTMQQQHHRKRLSSREKKKLKLYEIPREQQKYRNYDVFE